MATLRANSSTIHCKTPGVDHPKFFLWHNEPKNGVNCIPSVPSGTNSAFANPLRSSSLEEKQHSNGNIHARKRTVLKTYNKD